MKFAFEINTEIEKKCPFLCDGNIEDYCKIAGLDCRGDLFKRPHYCPLKEIESVGNSCLNCAYYEYTTSHKCNKPSGSYELPAACEKMLCTDWVKKEELKEDCPTHVYGNVAEFTKFGTLVKIFSLLDVVFVWTNSNQLCHYTGMFGGWYLHEIIHSVNNVDEAAKYAQKWLDNRGRGVLYPEKEKK